MWKIEAVAESVGEDGPIVYVGRAVIYPLSLELADLFHVRPVAHRVQQPREECALCRAGLCVQSFSPEDDTVTHGRWEDS